jgi:hypothetical protein
MPKNSNKPWTSEDDRRLLELAATGKPHVLIGGFVGAAGRYGWHITEGGRQFLASLEAPLSIAAEPVQAPS